MADAVPATELQIDGIEATLGYLIILTHKK